MFGVILELKEEGWTDAEILAEFPFPAQEVMRVKVKKKDKKKKPKKPDKPTVTVFPQPPHR